MPVWHWLNAMGYSLLVAVVVVAFICCLSFVSVSLHACFAVSGCVQSCLCFIVHMFRSVRVFRVVCLIAHVSQCPAVCSELSQSRCMHVSVCSELSLFHCAHVSQCPGVQSCLYFIVHMFHSVRVFRVVCLIVHVSQCPAVCSELSLSHCARFTVSLCSELSVSLRTFHSVRLCVQSCLSHCMHVSQCLTVFRVVNLIAHVSQCLAVFRVISVSLCACFTVSDCVQSHLCLIVRMFHSV